MSLSLDNLRWLAIGSRLIVTDYRITATSSLSIRTKPENLVILKLDHDLPGLSWLPLAIVCKSWAQQRHNSTLTQPNLLIKLDFR